MATTSRPSAPATSLFQHDTAMPCPVCGTIDAHRVEPGKGPHHAKLICTSCGSFLKWLPKPQMALADKQTWRSDPATEKQLATLSKLQQPHGQGISKGEASQLISAALASHRLHRLV